MKPRLLVQVLLGVLAVALVVTGVLLWTHPRQRTHTVAGPDPKITSQVISQVSTGLNQVFTYDYANPKPNEQAAAKWLTGDATGQFKTLFAQLQKAAKGQQLTTVSKVVTAGVISLKGNSAQLLVFLDQKSTRATDKVSRFASAQVQVEAAKHGDTWLISELRAL